MLEPSLLENVPDSHGEQDVDLAKELDPEGHIVTLVNEQLYPEGQSVQVDAAAYEYVPLEQAVFLPSLHEYPASQEVQLVDPASE